MHQIHRLTASFVTALCVLASPPTHALPVTLSGVIEFVASGSNVTDANGQAIRSALEGQAATLSLTVNTSVSDSDPSPTRLELLNAVTSSAAQIGGFAFGPGSTPCLDLDIDCRATAQLNMFGTGFDQQTISSELLTSNSFGLGSLAGFLTTSGHDLFSVPEIVDPASGTLDARMSVFYMTAAGRLDVVRFKLDTTPVTAPTPVPTPGTLPLLAIGLGLLGMRRRQA